MTIKNSTAKVFCFLNPLSCDGYALKKMPKIEKILKELDIKYELISFVGDLQIEAEKILKEGKVNTNDTFAGIGGDGTHSAIINGMMNFKLSNENAKLPFYSIIPLGTGNNLAKSFGLSRADSIFSSELRRTIAGTVYGAVFMIDVGKVNDRYFIDAFTSGVDAHILIGRNKDRNILSTNFPFLFRILRGYPLYVINTLKSLGRCKDLECTVAVDGQKYFEGGLFNVIVNNSRIYAGEFDPTYNAFANDGLLDIALHTGRRDYVFSYLLSYRKLPRRIREFFHKNRENKPHCKFRKAVITFAKKIPAQVDGEEFTPSERYEVEIIPQAIAMKIPVEPA